MQSDGVIDSDIARSDIEEPEEHGTEAHVHLPPTSIWPVTTAFGVTLAGAGIVTTYAVSILGGLIMLWGLVAWVQELRHELPH